MSRGCHRWFAPKKLASLLSVALLALCLVALAAAPAVADEPAEAGQTSSAWRITWDIYLWGASLGGQTATGENLSLSFSDLAGDLDIGFMSALGARKGRWSIFGDVIYLDVAAEDHFEANLVGNPIDVAVDVELKGLVAGVAGGYGVVSRERSALDVVFGVRNLDLETDLEFDIGPIKEPFSGSGDVFDAIVGVRGRADFAANWYFAYYVDLGTGDTDFTWQGIGSFGYRWKRADLVFGYRYLEWDFDDGDPGGKTFNDLNVSGPHVGTRIKF